MSDTSGVLTLWNRLSSTPGGQWTFARLVCLRSPYFASISPRVKVLDPKQACVAVAKKRKVLNHLGAVHAIALCNMAELAGGLVTEVALPITHGWIPTGMTVEYHARAETDVRATATLDARPELSRPSELPVRVAVRDTSEALVFTAMITMWVSPRDGNGRASRASRPSQTHSVVAENAPP